MDELERADDLAAMGDHEPAAAVYRQTRVAPGHGAAVAWRLGRLLYLQGDLDAALSALSVDPARHEQAGAPLPSTGSPADSAALRLAWRATVRWARGDLEGCARDVAGALGLAEGDTALAAAHTARALLAAAQGDRLTNETAYEVALRHARRAGDDLQEVRIRANRGSRLVEEGANAEALADLDHALGLVPPGRHPSMTALVLVNRGEALLRLGRPREALADVAAARMLQPTSTAPAAAYAMALLGDVHAALGHTALARLAYEEAVRTAAANGHAQALQLATAGLAVVLADSGEVGHANELLHVARSHRGQMAQVQLELAEAAVAVAAGDGERAATAARRAAQTARRRHDRRGLAAALELLGRAAVGPASVAALRQAADVHRAVGDPLAQARVDLALGAALGGEAGLRLADQARDVFDAAGAHAHARAARDVVARLAHDLAPPVVVRCLGTFQVTVDGVPVTPTTWGSRKPRDLLKILVAARGRPVPREVATEALWPGVEPRVAGPRLSVALSTLRRVLDADRPGAPAVLADRAALRLDPAVVDVDLERFLALARRAAADASLLEQAEDAFTGEFLPEDLDQDWTTAVRDQAREAHRGVLMASAEQALTRDDHDGAVRRCLRLLELDPADEDAHLSLVRALTRGRRHGEARRRYALYVTRMGELGLPAQPWSSVVPSPDREVG